MCWLELIDQNVINLGQTRKGGWKRRARQTGKRSGKELIELEGMEGDRVNTSGKRRFTL